MQVSPLRETMKLSRMGDATESQRIELYRRFFPQATELQARAFAEAHSSRTMAEFQGLLLALEQGGDRLEAVLLESEAALAGR
jgi:chaperone BCS1